MISVSAWTLLLWVTWYWHQVRFTAESVLLYITIAQEWSVLPVWQEKQGHRISMDAKRFGACEWLLHIRWCSPRYHRKIQNMHRSLRKCVCDDGTHLWTVVRNSNRYKKNQKRMTCPRLLNPEKKQIQYQEWCQLISWHFYNIWHMKTAFKILLIYRKRMLFFKSISHESTADCDCLRAWCILHTQ